MSVEVLKDSRIIINGVELTDFAEGEVITVNTRKLRKCFKYIKTEFPYSEIKRGDLLSFEATDPKDVWVEPGCILQAATDAVAHPDGGSVAELNALQVDSKWPGVRDGRDE